MKSLLIAAALAVTSTQTALADYFINVSGTFAKENVFPDAFGSTAATLPLSGTIVIEDAGLNTFPAGTVITNGSATNILAHDLTLVSTSAVKSASITIGNATWSAGDLLTLSYLNLGYAAVVIEGGITSPSNTLVGISVDKANVGNAILSALSCQTSSCALLNEGSAVDYLGFEPYGTISGLSATISVVWQLTVTTNGQGGVAVSPSGTFHTNNLAVSLTATPALNHVFTGWSGDATGTNNPLNVTMTTNKVIAANFQFVTNTATATIELVTTNGLAARIGWLAETNQKYQVLVTSLLDTNTWVNLGGLVIGNDATNYHVDPIVTGGRRFYRVITQP